MFMCGVCEGFYGKPWSTGQRKELFRRMHRFGMTTYLYAPKDDYKHRLYWRQLYSPEEQEELCSIIEAAKDQAVDFVYAISPGLDMVFSDKQDVDSLKNKLEQVQSFGCSNFALLFDDIDSELCDKDLDVYDLAAHAQAALTNLLYEHLNKPGVFLFCPTEYCNSRAEPDLYNSKYLKTIGETLDPGINVLWTGTKVVPRRLTVKDVIEVKEVLKRAPVIWDNLHANDYDQTRVYLGPYSGRPHDVMPYLSGVLTNPNCEFHANFVAMHTLAQWSRNSVEQFPFDKDNSDNAMETETPAYDATGALVCAVRDWIPEFYKPRGSASDIHIPKLIDVKENSDDDKPMEASRKERITECLTVNDLLLLCDLHYLPFEHGSRAVNLLKQAAWLIDNVDRLQHGVDSSKRMELSDEAREWYDQATSFHLAFKDLAMMVDKFVNIPNRELLYELYHYVSDMRSVLSLTNSYIKWNGLDRPSKEPFRSGEPEPWVMRGGLHAEFRRLLPLEGQHDLFPRITKPENKIYTFRPYIPADKPDIYTVCRLTFDNGSDGSTIFPDYPDLVADDSIGGLLDAFPELCYTVEDNAGICGYAACCVDIQQYQKSLVDDWLPKMRAKYPEPTMLSPQQKAIKMFYNKPCPIPDNVAEGYPSFIHMRLYSCDGEVGRRLLKSAAHLLRSRGSCGVHTAVYATHTRILHFYRQLGFNDITDRNLVSEELVLLGKTI